MAGLLDFSIYDDPNQSGRLAFAAGLLNAAGPQTRPVSVGQAISQGLLGGQQASQVAGMAQRRNQLVDIQMQQQRMQMEQLQRQQAEEAQARQLMQQYMQTPQTQAASLPGGPTQANAAMIPQMPGGFNAPGMRDAAMRAGNLRGVELAGSLAPKPNVQKLGRDDRLVDLSGPAPKTLVDAAPEKVDPNKPFLVIDGKIVPNPAFQQYELSKAKAGASSVNVNTAKPFLSELAGGLGKQVETAAGAARAAVGSINTANRLLEALDSGKVISGPTANTRIVLAQIGQMIGVGGKDSKETLLNTRQAMQAMAQLELDAAQQMKGQGQITEAERDIIRRAAAGDIESMTVPELRLLAKTTDKVARFRITSHQRNVEALAKDPQAAPLMPFLNVDAPPVYQGSGVIDFNDLPKAGNGR